jgi:hypothetical protein
MFIKMIMYIIKGGLPMLWLRFGTLALLLISLIGCRADQRKPVTPVQGQLLVDGAPAAHAIVVFHPVAGSGDDIRPTGTVDEEGNFKLTTYTPDDGAPEGEYLVSVTWYRAKKAGNDYTTVNRLPDRYARPDTSRLRATVKRDGDTPVIRIDTRKGV